MMNCSLNRIATLASAFAVCLTVLSEASAADPKVIAEQNRRIAVIESVAPAVVAVFAPGGAGGGSGVLISPEGYALSNFHVVAGVGSFMKCGLNDGVLYDAVIVGIDPTGDVALIKLLGRETFPYAPMGDSDKVQMGDWAYAMGNPFLLATDFQPTVTYGIVSGVHRYQYPAGTFLEYADCIQVDSSINPGNSGGPLFNYNGEVIGINGRGSFEKRGRVNVGAGYAISINQIKYFMDHLRSGRIVDHATLGATVFTSADGTVKVDQILEESEAFRRGLRSEDEIVEFAGRPIRNVNHFKNVLGIYPKGWRLPLVYRRDGEKHEILVRLRGLHRETELMPRRRPRQPPKKPGDKKPGDKKPDDDKKPQAPRPMQRPSRPKPKPPDKYKHLHVKKEGYANFYFNQLQQKRVLKAIKELGDFSKVADKWTIQGISAPDKPFTFTLAESGLGLEWNGGAFYQALDGSDFEDEPAGTGGLLIAMHHLKLMLTKNESAFTEFFYLGSEPLDANGQLVDVLVTRLTGVESWWYFNRKSGVFVGFDTQLQEDFDACQIRFDEFKTVQGRKFPGVIHVSLVDKPVASFQIRSIDVGSEKTASRK